MIMLTIETGYGEVLATASDETECRLIYKNAYQEGMLFRVQTAEPGLLWLRLDETLPPTLAYLEDRSAVYPIPLGEARTAYPLSAFSGGCHFLQARRPYRGEAEARRNLALNPYAGFTPSGFFPYASANTETRGEAVFAARNAIDGVTANHGHGEWPYTSWGINRDPAAALRIDFGRPVMVDEAVLYLRADFPHDAWWREAALHFSDGSKLVLPLQKTDAGQHFPFPPRVIEWAVLDTLIKADDPSPFPALTQLELWGTDLPGYQIC